VSSAAHETLSRTLAFQRYSSAMKARRTPLKDAALRQAGQPLREERERLFEDRFLPWGLASAATVGFAIYEWGRYLLQTPPQPWLMTVLATVTIGATVWRFFVLRPEMRRLRLAIEGETAVGQYLERLHAHGYQVFHDVMGNGFNIDHVLIGPAGIFTIETKTWNKPRGDSRVVFDGEQIQVAGLDLNRAPVVQAQSQANWLRTTIRDSTGREFEVRPVVVFPGWFVQAPPAALRKMWVLEPKALPSFLANEPNRLNETDRKLVRFHLSRIVRTNSAKP